MTITINNCPFCGHEEVEIDETGPAEFSVCCPECRAIGPICSDIMSAISAWNQAEKTADAFATLAVDVLKRAEDFICGFDGDDTQSGVDGLLEDIRNTIANLEGK